MKSDDERQPARRFAPNLRALAAAVGRSLPSLYRYRELGMPWVKGKRGWSVGRVRRWIQQNAPDAPPKSEAEVALEERRSEADARYRRARAQLVELKLAVESGLYLASSDVAKRDKIRIQLVRREGAKLAKRLARILHGLDSREMERVLDCEFRRFCLEMAQK